MSACNTHAAGHLKRPCSAQSVGVSGCACLCNSCAEGIRQAQALLLGHICQHALHICQAGRCNTYAQAPASHRLDDLQDTPPC